MNILRIVIWSGVSILAGGCAWFGGKTPPEWIMSPHQSYPAERYLTGIGEAESRDQAEKRAYAAIARVFTAQVNTQSMDHETYSIQESGVGSQTRRELQLDQRTQVTTSKALENVQILDLWYQPSTRHFWALAGLDRQQAEKAILERLQEWDTKIKNMIHQGRTHPQKIQRIRGYKEAMILLADRDTLNTDLRVIRTSGDSLPPSYRIPQIQREFMDFVAQNLVISVAIEGEYHEDIERAILEGLKQEGLLGRPADSKSSEVADLAIVGQGQFWTVNLPDPLFKYVRWCGDIDIYENPSHRLIGVISETGREGHVTEKEARIRASKVMQEVISKEIARLLTRSVFSVEPDPSLSQRVPNACSH
ncbi:LPP20 family lipoprotein [Nitrospira sp. T9]|uniref:LPP20 family lipoprotein n=1 Tax=unclassified Nitrospira TaxID=2652172 RepID=UPI003F9B971B